MTPEEMRSIDEATQRAYQLVFASPEGKRVLTDLAAYCHTRKTTFSESERVHCFNEGKRDVFLRIQEFTKLSLDEIYNLRRLK